MRLLERVNGIGRNEWTYLHPTNQRVIHLFLKQFPPLIVHTTPPPDILISPRIPCPLEDSRCQSPHDRTKDEIRNGEKRIVNCDLLGSFMTSSPIIVENNET